MVAESPRARRMTVRIPPEEPEMEHFPLIRRCISGGILLKIHLDWRRIATRHDRCAHTFFSAICLAVTVIFYLD